MNHGMHFSCRSSSNFFRRFLLAGILTVASFAFISSIHAGHAAAGFDPPANYPAGTGPQWVDIGNINGDAFPDLAVANRSSHNVSVLLGTGAGIFGAATNFAVGNFPTSVVIRDLNGDGFADLTVSNSGLATASVLLGDGSGSFGTPTDLFIGSNPNSLAVGDLNGDAFPDLVVANNGSEFSVRLGIGDGTFGPRTAYPIGFAAQVFSVAIGDLNGDGFPDVAAASRGQDRVSVRLGNGTGSFGPEWFAPLAGAPTSVAIGDLDGDGFPDLVTANTFLGNVSVLLGDGSGTFGSPTSLAVGTAPFSVAIRDLDGDGNLDIATANAVSGNVSVLPGAGDGTFGSAVNHPAGSFAMSLAIGDLNGDGAPDIATANASVNNVSVLLNDSPVADTQAPDTIIDTATPGSPANTGVRTFTFHGEDPAPASTPITYECRVDGGAWFACSSGYATPNLPDGSHTFDVRASDAAGNTDASPANSTWVVDKTAPNTIIDSATPASPTNNQVRNFTFHGTDPAPGTPITLECQLDGGAWFSCNSGTYNTGTLPEGNHTFRVRAIDAASNVDPTPATSTWMIDLTDPTIDIVSPGVRERFVMGSGAKNYSCDDPLFGGPPPVASGVDTCTDHGFSTAHLGNFRFQVDAKDNAGNTSTEAHAYAVDPPKYADLVTPHNPIAYYRLGDPLGSDSMADSSGHNRNGEFKNGIALRRPPAPNCHVRPHAPYTCDLTADPQDWAAFFPARDGYGFTNNITAPQTGYTIEGWIKRADNNDGSIMGQGGAGQLFVSGGRLALRQTQDTVYASGPQLTPGEWFHVAGTWDGSETRLYVNGNLVGSSNSANKPPSGSATLYVGYGDQAPWFHGSLDEMAYYGSALPGSAFATRYEVGTAHDVPSPVGGPPIQRPEPNMHQPNNGGLYAHTKVPNLDFFCEDLDGNATVASCTATVDGNPTANHAVLPDTPGPHVVVVTAVDNDGLTRSHTHTYTVKSFEDIYNTDSPIAYYRLGDATGDWMKDSGPQGRHGTYKNDQESGPVGISGDLDHARKFFGEGGYGFVSSIPAPTFQSSIEAWVNPDDHRNQSVVGHGDAGEIYIQDGLFVFKHMGTSVTSHVGPTPGEFTQVVGVWDGVTISIYVNGELHGQTEATKRPSSSSTFYVGYGEIRPWFKGSLDEVAYYGKALTANRVLEHFLADPPPPNDKPVITDPGNDPDTPVSNDPAVDTPPNPTPVKPPVSKPSNGPAAESSGTKSSNPGKRVRPDTGAAKKKCKKFKKNKVKYKRCLKKSRKKG